MAFRPGHAPPPSTGLRAGSSGFIMIFLKPTPSLSIPSMLRIIQHAINRFFNHNLGFFTVQCGTMFRPIFWRFIQTDPLRLPTCDLQQAHRPISRRAPGGQFSGGVPNHHLPETLSSGAALAHQSPKGYPVTRSASDQLCPRLSCLGS